MLLAISTAHDICSAALLDGTRVLASAEDPIGRGHEARLAPMIRDLLREVGGRPSAILVDVGPGSFTGIRVGLATARGLGLGWGVVVDGCASDRIVAAQAFAAAPGLARVLVVLDGRRGEVFARVHGRQAPEGEPRAIPRADAAPWARDVGAVAAPPAMLTEFAWSGVERLAATPSAAACRWLDPTDRKLPPVPIYVRAPDARPQR